jgi:hypothetical protein
MARTVTEYGGLVGVTISLGNLAANAAFESAAIDNSTNRYLDAWLELTIVLANSGTIDPNGTINVYIAPSVGGTVWPSPATGANSSISGLALVTPIAQIPTGQFSLSATVKFVITSIATALAGGMLPQHYSIIIENKTGVAFASAGHTISYGGVWALTS